MIKESTNQIMEVQQEIDWDCSEVEIAIMFAKQIGQLNKKVKPDKSRKPKVKVVDKTTGEIKLLIPIVTKGYCAKIPSELEMEGQSPRWRTE